MKTGLMAQCLHPPVGDGNSPVGGSSPVGDGSSPVGGGSSPVGGGSMAMSQRKTDVLEVHSVAGE